MDTRCTITHLDSHLYAHFLFSLSSFFLFAPSQARNAQHIHGDYPRDCSVRVPQRDRPGRVKILPARPDIQQQSSIMPSVE